jgi:hypothetical protein
MSSRRVNVRAILGDPDLRRKLMIPALQATQAREGIETSKAQAERAYYVVTEGERTTYVELEKFRGTKDQPDLRHRRFVESLAQESSEFVHRVPRRDMYLIEGAVLAFASIGWLAPLYKDVPPLAPTHGATRSGLNTTEIERFTRLRWEVSSPGVRRTWVPFAKGGDYARFYTDWDLCIDWTDDGADFKAIVADKYGSASRFVKSERDYFKTGITWMQTTNLGINARPLPEGGIFGVASPSLFPSREDEFWPLLSLMNSGVFDAIARCVATRNWGATAVGSIPVPPMPTPVKQSFDRYARTFHGSKATWDAGNEISLGFRAPWLIREDLVSSKHSLPDRLSALEHFERAEDERLQGLYVDLNDEVYRLYAIPDKTRRVIEEMVGTRPPELLWPQMGASSTAQKRMEHVHRLLSHLVRRVIEQDDDGIVPYTSIAGEASLLDRVHAELAAAFPALDVRKVEVDIANELKKKVKGYRSVSSIAEWLEHVFFDYHASLYKNRPVIWHIASAQGTSPCAFGVLVDYHRFDKNHLAKLRGGYLRDAVESFRREAGLADKEGRADDRAEWQARVEEAQALDLALQRIQEGRIEGTEEGPQDYRILTPWKAAAERPRGWDPDLDDGVKVNIEPFEKAGALRVAKVT